MTTYLQIVAEIGCFEHQNLGFSSKRAKNLWFWSLKKTWLYYNSPSWNLRRHKGLRVEPRLLRPGVYLRLRSNRGVAGHHDTRGKLGKTRGKLFVIMSTSDVSFRPFSHRIPPDLRAARSSLLLRNIHSYTPVFREFSASIIKAGHSKALHSVGLNGW